MGVGEDRAGCGCDRSMGGAIRWCRERALLRILGASAGLHSAGAGHLDTNLYATIFKWKLASSKTSTEQYIRLIRSIPLVLILIFIIGPPPGVATSLRDCQRNHERSVAADFVAAQGLTALFNGIMCKFIGMFQLSIVSYSSANEPEAR